MRRVIAHVHLGGLLASHEAARHISTEVFAGTAEKTQAQLATAGDRKSNVLRHGKHLYESEVLDDVTAAYTPQVAARICHAASMLRVPVVKSQPYSAIVEASTSDAAIAAMDIDSLARIIHSCLVLRSPLLYDVLFSYIGMLARGGAGAMSGVSVAVLINAYGRAGVHHDRLYQTLCDSAAKSMIDPSISLAHVANVAHALSRVHFKHGPLMLVLRDQALTKCPSASPIIAITLLDAFAELQAGDAEFFGIYEKHILTHLQDLQAPLLASLLHSIVLADRGGEEMMQTLGERIVAIAPTFDSTSIARVCDAYLRANVLSEEVLGAMAERACAVVNEFRADEVCLALNALSTFDLFDAELFPLLGSRASSLFRQGEHISVSDAAGILASFAAVQERNDELIHCCTQVFAAHLGSAAPPSAHINALWACASLSVRNEAQMKMVAEAKAHPSMLDLSAETRLAAGTRATLEERRAFAAKAYGIQLN